MSYLFYNIPFFLLLAALLGFVIGWLLRGNRFQSELQDLDARWRSKLGEVESERDRFAADVTQANEERAKYEASAAEAHRLAEGHEATLQQLRREHQSKLDTLGDAEQRLGGLESQLAGRDKALADAEASLTKVQASGADSKRVAEDLAAATGRAEGLERDLQQSREAQSACKREVERLQARIAELQGGDTSGGNALGLMGSSGSTAEGGDSSSSESTDATRAPGASGVSGTASGASSAPLGLVGGRDVESSTGGSGNASHQGEQSGLHGQATSSPSESSGGGISPTATGSATAGSSGSGGDDEGERPEALSEARGGVADDLKKISGVGPKLEKTLNGLGIFHFAQIAAFTPSNVAWVDRHLRFKGRIERENWIEQARVLAAGGETEFSRRN